MRSTAPVAYESLPANSRITTYVPLFAERQAADELARLDAAAAPTDRPQPRR